jgi:hypothetical protein
LYSTIFTRQNSSALSSSLSVYQYYLRSLLGSELSFKMGNALSDPYGSALRKDSCSGRNITWNYIHNHCLPTTYASCPHAAKILHSHNCLNGACHPNSHFDKEFERYGWYNWDGLGDPFPPGEKLKESGFFSHTREDGPDTFQPGETCLAPYVVIPN